MDKKDFYEWEKMAVSSILSLMVHWFGFSRATMEVSQRPEVASRVWFSIKIERDDGKTWYVDGQRTDIVRKRLIEFLDLQKIREDYLEEEKKKTQDGDRPFGVHP